MSDRPPRLIFFTRWAAAGRVKTRLIPKVGALRALDLHRQMSAQIYAEARTAAARLGADLEVRFVGGSEHRVRSWLGHDGLVAAQGSGTIGVRMRRALSTALFEGAPWAMLFGSDLPDLRHTHFEDAARRIASHDVVLGPAKDGGYYLIAVKQDHSRLFAGIEWSTPAVLPQTLAACRTDRLTVTLLDPLADLDRPEDFANWPWLLDP